MGRVYCIPSFWHASAGVETARVFYFRAQTRLLTVNLATISANDWFTWAHLQFDIKQTKLQLHASPDGLPC